MAKGKRPSRVEKELEEIHACRDDPTSPQATRVLRAALDGGSSFAVAAAAKLVAAAGIEALAAPLLPAYRRIADADPGCGAKSAIVAALCELGREDGEVFLRAARHRQLEPAFGGPVDTAARLRATAAAGLASMQHPDAGLEIARLLADPEPLARAGAARAAARLGVDVGAPLLVLRATAGDAEAEVLGECFRALLELAPGRLLDLVVARLDDDEAVAEQAALALGESRLPEAFAPLRDYCERAPGPRRRVGYVALALLRRDDASAYLLKVVEDEATANALLALEALAVHKHDPRVRDALLAAVGARDDAALRDKAAQLLG